MLLSIVIPFYHVEEYIGACLDEAAKFPAADCEILLVDDCGGDRSAAIAQRYASRYNHFRMLRRAQNGGLSAARNTGLSEAKGEYVYFLDSDDLPEPAALMELARAAKAQNLDVAKARFLFLDDETNMVTPGPAISHTEPMTGCALFAAQCREGVYEPMVWQCVYRRSFLEQHRLVMAEGLLFEDELFQASVLMKAQRAAAFETPILRYRQRHGSIMSSFARSSRWCSSYLEICRRLDALAKSVSNAAALAALKRRIGQIAISSLKNITAYCLPKDVAQEAEAFAHAHRRELAGYALRSGDLFVALQGALLLLSPHGFLALYRHH